MALEVGLGGLDSGNQEQVRLDQASDLVARGDLVGPVATGAVTEDVEAIDGGAQEDATASDANAKSESDCSRFNPDASLAAEEDTINPSSHVSEGSSTSEEAPLKPDFGEVNEDLGIILEPKFNNNIEWEPEVVDSDDESNPSVPTSLFEFVNGTEGTAIDQEFQPEYNFTADDRNQSHVDL